MQTTSGTGIGNVHIRKGEMKLYRYEGYRKVDIKNPIEYLVHRETKYRYVIYHGYTKFLERKEKFIGKAGKKRFAYPTKKEAMINYIARKRSQIEHCTNMINLAETGLFNVGKSVKTALCSEERDISLLLN